MKKLSLLFFAMSLFTQTFGQVQANIASQNMEALIANKMALFGDATAEYKFSQFKAPKGLLISPIAISNLWITGTNEDSTIIYSSSELHEGYSPNNQSFWNTGPISTDTSLAFFFTYNRVWKITKQQIDLHKILFNNFAYIMPEVIRNWPANGNTSYDESKVLASYEDVNKNNIYDPQNGDYPIIIGDNAVLSIFNDTKNPNGFGIEIYRMVYTYNNIETANNIFVNYTLRNQSNNQYNNVRLSSWNDYDLGNGTDDYVGSAPSKNAIVVYNGDSIDENGPQGNLGYGIYPPAFGTMFLNTHSSSSLYFTSDFNVNGYPSSPLDFYNYANARWRDGSNMVYGGDGVSTNNGGTGNPNQKAYHMFPDHPLGTDWNETNTGNQPGDRRMIMSTESYTLIPNGTLCLDLAYCFGINIGNIPYKHAGYDALMAIFDSTQLFFDKQVNACSNINHIDSLRIHASDYFLCMNGEVDYTLEGFNFSSEVVNWEFPGASQTTYTGLNPTNINYPSPGFYDVHCTIHFLNGDSVVINRANLIEVKEQTAAPLVDGIDLLFNDSCSVSGFTLMPINASNYGFNALFEYSTTTLGVFASSYSGQVSSNADLQNGDTLVLTITSTDDCLVTQTANTSIIVALLKPNYSTIQHPSNLLEVTDPTQGVTYQWYIVLPNGNWYKLDSEKSRTFQAKANGRYVVEINFGGGCILSSDIFEITTVGIQENASDFNLSISPNPSHGQNITVINKNTELTSLTITIYNSIGKVVSTVEQPATQTFELQTNSLPSGQYLISFESETGHTIKSLIIL